MIRYANLQPGEIVLDPMCGCGTIPIEISLQKNWYYTIGGDITEESITQSRTNCNFSQTIDSITDRFFSVMDKSFCETLRKRSFKPSIIRWDVSMIPLRDNSVDVVICDMPFGRRSGSYMENSSLYPKFMNEMARIITPQGRLILLTLQKKLLGRVIASIPCLRIVEVAPCYMGGLQLSLYRIEHQ